MVRELSSDSDQSTILGNETRQATSQIKETLAYKIERGHIPLHRQNDPISDPQPRQGVRTDKKNVSRGRGLRHQTTPTNSSIGRTSSNSGSSQGDGTSRSSSALTSDKQSSNKYALSNGAEGASSFGPSALSSLDPNRFSEITGAAQGGSKELVQTIQSEKAKTKMLSAETYASYYDKVDGRYIPPEYEDLPILRSRKEILEKLETHQCLIVTGETGSGKSTQVPQYILDWYAEKNEGARIWVTQPRRIAAISIAERVADSRIVSSSGKHTWGKCGQGIVGYQVGLDRNASPDARIIYMTPGIVSNKMQSDRHLNGVSVLIIDEVHERDLETEMLLLLVKHLLAENPDIKGSVL